MHHSNPHFASLHVQALCMDCANQFGPPGNWDAEASMQVPISYVDQQPEAPYKPLLPQHTPLEPSLDPLGPPSQPHNLDVDHRTHMEPHAHSHVHARAYAHAGAQAGAHSHAYAGAHGHFPPGVAENPDRQSAGMGAVDCTLQQGRASSSIDEDPHQQPVTMYGDATADIKLLPHAWDGSGIGLHSSGFNASSISAGTGGLPGFGCYPTANTNGFDASASADPTQQQLHFIQQQLTQQLQSYLSNKESSARLGMSDQRDQLPRSASVPTSQASESSLNPSGNEGGSGFVQLSMQAKDGSIIHVHVPSGTLPGGGSQTCSALPCESSGPSESHGENPSQTQDGSTKPRTSNGSSGPSESHGENPSQAQDGSTRPRTSNGSSGPSESHGENPSQTQDAPISKLLPSQLGGLNYLAP
eukprot:gene8665-34116_t